MTTSSSSSECDVNTGKLVQLVYSLATGISKGSESTETISVCNPASMSNVLLERQNSKLEECCDTVVFSLTTNPGVATDDSEQATGTLKQTKNAALSNRMKASGAPITPMHTFDSPKHKTLAESLVSLKSVGCGITSIVDKMRELENGF